MIGNMGESLAVIGWSPATISDTVSRGCKSGQPDYASSR